MSDHADLAAEITSIWERRSGITAADLDVVSAVLRSIELLDSGAVRVAEPPVGGADPVVHEWLKYAILLFFQLSAMDTVEVGPFEYVDKIPLKRDYESRGVRVVPGASARWGSYQAPGVVLMPSYCNIGSYVGENSMIDTWATVGSCAQIGANVHIAGGVGIGGVLEPAEAAPVMIGDDAFIGSRCMVTSGARVGAGAVLGAGVILNSSIPVIDAESGDEISRGVVPDWSVTVFATRPREFPGGTFGLPCALVIKRLSEGERHDKTALNDTLRTHGIAL